MGKPKKEAPAEAPTSKTESLQRLMVDVHLLHPNPLNPNEMSEAQFNLLSDNIERMGVTDPILVQAHPEHPGEYLIIGGQHRWEVAKMQGIPRVPITLITDPEFSSDEAAFQTVRHNIIGGKMNPAKFVKLVESLSKKYSDDVAAEMFGFVDEDEFKKLLKTTEKSLPKELQEKFKEAAKELKTIDDLAKLLNQLFASHGDTLDHGYMIFDYGGKESIWLRQQVGQLKHFRAVADKVRAEGKALDHVFATLVAHLATTDNALLVQLIADAPAVAVKAEAPYATLDYLD